MAHTQADPGMFGKRQDEPFKWRSEHGTWFEGKCDLRDGVTVSKPRSEIKLEEFMCFGAWHAINVHGDLNGFSGYDCVRFTFAETEDGTDTEDDCPEEYFHEPYMRCQCGDCCEVRNNQHKEET